MVKPPTKHKKQVWVRNELFRCYMAPSHSQQNGGKFPSGSLMNNPTVIMAATESRMWMRACRVTAKYNPTRGIKVILCHVFIYDNEIGTTVFFIFGFVE